PAYTKNVSLARIRHHRRLASEFLRLALTLPPPDAIVASMTPLELARAAGRYGRRCNVPVVVDVRDFWPTIFLEVAPPPLRPLARLAIEPFYRMLRETVDLATAVSGVSDAAVDWALAQRGRARGPFDVMLPLASQPVGVSQAAMDEAGRFWDALNVRERQERFTVCFVGTLSRRIEFDTVLM